MNSNRLKSTYKNTIWTFFLVIVTSVFPFIIRTSIIRYIGIEYAGVSSLFTSVLQIINVVDLGIDSAITYYLYKPMTDRYNHTDEIGRIMNLFKHIYYSVGAAVLAIGIILIPLIPFMVRGKSYPQNLNILYIYIIYILNCALPYFTGTYKSVLFTSNQQTHVIKCVGGFTALIMYVSQITTLFILHDFYIYTLLLLVNAILPGVIVGFLSKQKFPEIKIKGLPDEAFISQFRKQISAMAISKIRNISRNSLDSLVISIFIGLVMVAKYQNYYQVLVIPILIIDSIRGIITPALGNGVASETSDSNYGVLELYTFIQNFFITIAVSCLLNLMQPFIKLWIGSEYLLPRYVVVLFCIYFFILETSNVVVLMRETTGMWWKGRYIALAETLTNLILNVLLVRFFGVGGVIFATIITIGCINIPMELHYIFKYYFQKSVKSYIMQLVSYALKGLIIAVISYYICSVIPDQGIVFFCIKAISTIIVSISVFCVVYIKNVRLKASFDIVRRMVQIRGR